MLGSPTRKTRLLKVKPYILSLLSTFAMAWAWWVPGSALCAVLGWVASLLLVASVRSTKNQYRALYLAGVVFQPLGFYWLYTTISFFGGFNAAASTGIFFSYAVLSAAQYLVFVFLYRNSPSWLDGAFLRIAIAWTGAEYISVRIFPWYFGHTQVAFVPFVQIADLGGALLVTFVMVWISEALLRLIFGGERRAAVFFPLCAGGACILYGMGKIQEFDRAGGTRLSVSLVQANVTVEEKHNMKLFAQNVDRYVALTKGLDHPGQLIIWPESVIVDYLYAGMRHVSEDERLPWLGPGNAMLIGALSFDDDRRLYNSAVGISADGSIAPFYHKQVLMPFGEYLPFKNLIPWLGDIHPIGEITPGSAVSVMPIMVRKGDGSASDTANVSALICYEDVVTDLAREATLKGAELLVNLTNDGWFGDTVAPKQHHMIAAFRAIENRRYLLRSTNTGLTAMVDPLGRTTSSIKPYSDGSLSAEVALLKKFSPFTLYIGVWPWRALLLLWCLWFLVNYKRSFD